MTRAPFIDTTELARALAGPDRPVLLDVSLLLHRAEHDGDFRAESGRPGWQKAHIPGAIHVAIDTDLSVADATHDRHPEPQQLADAVATVGIGAHTPVVVYDSTGGLWAARAWYLLDWIGVPVRVLDGGLGSWQRAGLPTAADPAAAPHPVRPWTASARSEAWIEHGEVLRIYRTATNLVCGLSPASFTGAEPTRYSRRGHIPGSRNVPARALFDDRGCIRSASEIETLFRAEGVDLNAEVLLYCGGGISATANALALASIGVRHTRVYDGSLEEWSADPALPLWVG